MTDDTDPDTETDVRMTNAERDAWQRQLRTANIVGWAVLLTAVFAGVFAVALFVASVLGWL